jgi:hypothetical protein
LRVVFATINLASICNTPRTNAVYEYGRLGDRATLLQTARRKEEGLSVAEEPQAKEERVGD